MKNIADYIVVGSLLFVSQGFSLTIVRMWFSDHKKRIDDMSSKITQVSSSMSDEIKQVKTLISKEVNERKELDKQVYTKFADRDKTYTQLHDHDKRISLVETRVEGMQKVIPINDFICVKDKAASK